MPATSAAPHSEQNFCSGTTAWPQLGHDGAIGVPHSIQNLAPVTFSVPHCGQAFAPPVTPNASLSEPVWIGVVDAPERGSDDHGLHAVFWERLRRRWTRQAARNSLRGWRPGRSSEGSRCRYVREWDA